MTEPRQNPVETVSRPAVAPSSAALAVRVGTSGFSCGGWVGPFYPEGTPRARMFDEYVKHFDTVELNFTFYAMPGRRTLASLARRAPPDFRFFVKAHQTFTHGRDLGEAERFLGALEPLRSGDRLAGVLFQFPESFQDGPDNRRYLADLAGRFAPALVRAVEFRHGCWANPDVFRVLEDLKLALVMVDVPENGRLFPRLAAATHETAYLRFHSRAAANWYQGLARRYDYSYSDAELGEWVGTLRTVAARSRALFVYFNNCHRGQAARNAQAMKRVLQHAGWMPRESTPVPKSHGVT